MLKTMMSFYHVLPSNAAPDTFPLNHASSFSIPLDNPYNLSGQWEVAMMNISYTGCVNTFNNDELVVTSPVDLKTRILRTQSPVIWKVPQKKTVGEMLAEIKASLKDILEVNIKGKYCTWKLQSDHLFVIMNQGLTNAAKLEQDVITSWDENVRNSSSFNHKDAMPKDVSIIFVPITYAHKTIEMKAANETITLQQCISNFNERVPNASMMEKEDKIKLTINENIILFSSNMSQFLNLAQSGIHMKPPPPRASIPNTFMNMKEPWTIMIYALDNVADHATPLNQTITLPPISFQRHQDAVAYLNTLVPKCVTFSIDDKKYLQATINDAAVRITFSNTLRDIFAFDENTYTGLGTYKASGIFSLTRRIHYLYVYSNITDYVRIGNTEAPLLAVIPFSVNSNCDILKEESYKNPMYIPIRHPTMSQIDFEIHDDAGDLVPFVAEAVTSLRLHYRQI